MDDWFDENPLDDHDYAPPPSALRWTTPYGGKVDLRYKVGFEMGDPEVRVHPFAVITSPDILPRTH